MAPSSSGGRNPGLVTFASRPSFYLGAPLFKNITLVFQSRKFSQTTQKHSPLHSTMHPVNDDTGAQQHPSRIHPVILPSVSSTEHILPSSQLYFRNMMNVSPSHRRHISVFLNRSGRWYSRDRTTIPCWTYKKSVRHISRRNPV